MIKKFLKFQFNKKNFQAGVSLPLVIGAFAIISIGTYYILDVNRRNKVMASRARNTSFSELERRRVTAVLSSEIVCSDTNNFGTTSISSNISKAKLVSGSGANLITTIAPGNSYYGNVLTLQTIQLTTSGPLVTSGNYNLVLTYKDMTGLRQQYTGKETTIITIPMFVQVSAGKITSCYAKTNNVDVDKVITAVCSPASQSVGTSMSTLITDTGIATACRSDINFADNSNLLDRNTTCSGNLLLNGYSKSGNNLVFDTTANCSAFPVSSPNNYCSGYASGDRLYDLSNSNLTCATPAVTARDVDAGSPSICSTNQMLYRNSDSSTSCASSSLSCASMGTYYFITSITVGSGASCTTAPSTSCGPGQYISSFNPLQCKDLPVMSGSCGAGNFGYKIYRANNGANGQLICNPYSTYRPCPATSTPSTTFAYAINGSSVSCYQF